MNYNSWRCPVSSILRTSFQKLSRYFGVILILEMILVKDTKELTGLDLYIVTDTT